MLRRALAHFGQASGCDAESTMRSWRVPQFSQRYSKIGIAPSPALASMLRMLAQPGQGCVGPWAWQYGENPDIVLLHLKGSLPLRIRPRLPGDNACRKRSRADLEPVQRKVHCLGRRRHAGSSLQSAEARAPATGPCGAGPARPPCARNHQGDWRFLSLSSPPSSNPNPTCNGSEGPRRAPEFCRLRSEFPDSRSGTDRYKLVGASNSFSFKSISGPRMLLHWQSYCDIQGQPKVAHAGGLTS